MPSRSNPNTPSSLKRKTASKLQSKRQRTQRLAHNKVTKPTPRTSQALKQSAPLSKKRARKLEKKVGFAQERRMEEIGDVEMKDVDAGEKKRVEEKLEIVGAPEEKMNLDGIK